MAAIPIEMNEGETLHREFFVTGLTCDVEKDRMLFVIRNRDDQPVFYKALVPIPTTAPDEFYFILDIPHSKSEKALTKGTYKYGLTFYKDAVDADGDGMVDDGTVVVAVARETFRVNESVAREEGIY